MNKNTLLNIAVLVCNFAKLILSLIFIAISILLIHFQIDRSAYDDWNIKNPNNSSELIILVFLSIHQFQKVIQSVKNLHTFQSLNVRSFRKIALYCILIFFLNTFSYWDLGTYIAQTVIFNTTPLLIALFAFIFAEIFKEGNLLMEENNLTV